MYSSAYKNLDFQEKRNGTKILQLSRINLDKMLMGLILWKPSFIFNVVTYKISIWFIDFNFIVLSLAIKLYFMWNFCTIQYIIILGFYKLGLIYIRQLKMKANIYNAEIETLCSGLMLRREILDYHGTLLHPWNFHHKIFRHFAEEIIMEFIWWNDTFDAYLVIILST